MVMSLSLFDPSVSCLWSRCFVESSSPIMGIRLLILCSSVNSCIATADFLVMAFLPLTFMCNPCLVNRFLAGTVLISVIISKWFTILFNFQLYSCTSLFTHERFSRSNLCGKEIKITLVCWILLTKLIVWASPFAELFL